MKRISILAHKNGTNTGWATVAHFVQKYLLDAGFQVDFIPATELKLFSLASKLGPLGWLLDFVRLKPVLDKNEMTLVLCEPLLPISIIHKMFRPKTKVVLVGFGTYIYFPFIRGLLHKIHQKMLQKADLVLVSSNYTRQKVAEFYPDQTKLKVWALGVDSDIYKLDPLIQKEEKILFVGHQKERKGIWYLLEAFSSIASEFPSLKLYFVGPIDQKFQQHTSSLALSDRIIFSGPISLDSLVHEFNTAVLHVLPSVNTNDSFEGFGLVHLEANACGTPSIGSKGTANEDVIMDCETGYLVEQRNAADLANKIRLALSNTDKYNVLRQNALNHAHQFTWKKSVHHLIKFIEQC